MLGYSSYLPAYEDGTDRVFRKVCVHNSEAGELPRRNHTTMECCLVISQTTVICWLVIALKNYENFVGYCTKNCEKFVGYFTKL